MSSEPMRAVLLDAGSSGTRIYIYEWEYNGNPHETIIGTIDGWKDKKSVAELGGIQNLAPLLPNLRDDGKPIHLSKQIEVHHSTSTLLAETGRRVANYLDPLLTHARGYLRSNQIKNTPLFMLATGGMRRHKTEHYEEYMILREAIIEYINKSGFMRPIYDTISGEDEALYGWVAANQVDKCFGPDKTPHGFMEMGGESAQFAVALRNKEEYDGYDGLLRKVTIWEEEYTVYVKTWMGFGGESAWKRHEARLRNSDSVMPLDPCLPRGYSYRLSGSDKVVQGTGDFEGCMKEALSLLSCPDKNCASGDLCIYRPKPGDTEKTPLSIGCLLRDNDTGNPTVTFNKTKFCGASVYRHATHGIFVDSSHTMEDDDFSRFWDNVVYFSKFDWETLKAKRARERNTEYQYLKRSFFTAAMIMSTLFVGFGIPMPPQAMGVAKQFALDRSEQALFDAEEALSDANKKHIEAQEAWKRAEASSKRADEEAKNAETLPPLSSSAMEDLNECKKIYEESPNDANRQDYLDAAKAVMRGSDRLASSKEAARIARLKMWEAADKEKETYDTWVKALSRKRNSSKIVENLKKPIPVADELHQGATSDLQEAKYKTIPNADWTLGRIVLYINGCKPTIMSKYGWGGTIKDQAVV